MRVFAPAHGREAPEAGPRDGVIDWITEGVTAAINAFFKGLVSAALEPLLKLLGDSLLTTPSPESLPRIGELWTDSWHLALAVYPILIMVAGVLLMAHGTVQARYSLRELGPRIPLAFLAAGFSLVFATKAVDLANALSMAVLGGGLDKDEAGAALREFVLASFVPSGNIFGILLWGVVAAVLVALLVTFIVRVALTIVLIAGAPLALMCHALPLTDGVARWWWRIFTGLLAIQVAQSMALDVGIRVFLTPGNFSPFGPTKDGFVSVLVALALMYILFRIPFWILSSVRHSHGGSFVGRLARAALAYRVFGMLRGARRTAVHGAVRGAPPGPFRPGPTPTPVLSPAGAPRHRAAGGRLAPGGVPAAQGPRRPPGMPLFLAPNQAAPTTPGGSAPHAATPTAPGENAPWPRPTPPPGLPQFRAPALRQLGTSSPRRDSPPAPRVPTRFQPPVTDPPASPRQAHSAPPPATFQEPLRPQPPAQPRPPRRFAPPPPYFSSPAPPRRPEGGGRLR
ncbi:hypothetical protein ABT039_25605 [Streptomyces lasiicapitis]|uniref:hypothetical protein n=1 Tax=Streptomyces lasiicapitis TaxID=1923961 RepID=UPI003328E9B2